MPHKDSLLSRPLAGLTSGVLHAPKVVLATALIISLISILVTVRWLGFRTSRLDLLNPKASYNQRWLAYLEEFGDRDDVVVVIEADDPDIVVSVLQNLATELGRDERLFEHVLYRPDLSQLRSKALHYLSGEQLQRLEQFLMQMEPVLRGDWAQLNLLRQLEWARASSATGVRRVGWDDMQPAAEPGSVVSLEWNADVESPGEPAPIHTLLATALDDPAQYESPWSPLLDGIQQVSDRFQSQFLLSDEGRLGFLLLRITTDEDGFVRDREALAKLRSTIEDVQMQFPEARIGLTGMPVLESDEMQSSQDDTIRASALSLVGVALIFVAGFGGWRGPMLTVATLMLALAWSFGYITLAVGHLNILSVSFGIILIGLGIDFGIHYLARYQQVRETVTDSGGALRETARSVGPGIVTGGLTTALAFCTAAMTHFTGIAELGIIAGGGIILCMIAALVVLPALIYWSDQDRADTGPPATLPITSLCEPVHRYPRTLLLTAAIASVLLGVAGFRLHYDHNLLNLQPLRTESVELERRLATHTNRSVWYALSVANSRAELAERKAQFESLDVVADTEEIASLVPTVDRGREQAIRRIAQRLRNLPDQPPVIPVTKRAVLTGHFSQAVKTAEAALLVDQLMRLPDHEYYARVSRFQQTLAHELLRLLHLIRVLADPAAPSQGDVPDELSERFVGRNGRHLIKVYGRGSIWDMDELKRFVGALESVDSRVTGHPVQTYYASRHMQQSYLHAAVYSLLAVAIVLMLDFRSLRYTLLAMIPVVLGLMQLCGLLGLLNIALNPANMIVLPLILGIGIDDGVHVVHDFLRQKERYRISNSTASAVVITSATTMIGFGSMMFSRHQGLRSLGQVLTLGVFCCLVSSLLVLPPLLGRLRPASQPNPEVVD